MHTAITGYGHCSFLPLLYSGKGKGMDDIQLEQLDMDIPDSVGDMVLSDEWQSEEWEDDSMFKQITIIDWD